MYENRAEREKENEVIENTFGPNEQPTLEKIEYQVCYYLSDSSGPRLTFVKCFVTSLHGFDTVKMYCC